MNATKNITADIQGYVFASDRGLVLVRGKERAKKEMAKDKYVEAYFLTPVNFDAHASKNGPVLFTERDQSYGQLWADISKHHNLY